MYDPVDYLLCSNAQSSILSDPSHRIGEVLGQQSSYMSFLL